MINRFSPYYFRFRQLEFQVTFTGEQYVWCMFLIGHNFLIRQNQLLRRISHLKNVSDQKMLFVSYRTWILKGGMNYDGGGRMCNCYSCKLYMETLILHRLAVELHFNLYWYVLNCISVIKRTLYGSIPKVVFH